MIESTAAWKSDIQKTERILRQLAKAADGLREINPEHVSTGFSRQHLVTAFECPLFSWLKIILDIASCLCYTIMQEVE